MSSFSNATAIFEGVDSDWTRQLPTPPHSRSGTPPGQYQRNGHKLLTANDVSLGLIASLKHNNIGPDSVFYGQSWMNATSSNHPTCIVGTKDNGNISICLQVTSFSGKTLQEKYWDSNNPMRLHYLALDSGYTVPHNGLQMLRLANGNKMKKQSYVHLDHFFEIETRYLEPWATGTYQLEGQSLAYLLDRFRIFITGGVQRLTTEILSPLDILTADSLQGYIPATTAPSTSTRLNVFATPFSPRQIIPTKRSGFEVFNDNTNPRKKQAMAGNWRSQRTRPDEWLVVKAHD